VKRIDRETLDQAVRLRADGWDYNEIQEILDVGRTTVVKYARIAKEPHRKRGPKPFFGPETRALACDLYAAEQPMDEICARTGASRDMVRRWAREAGLTMRTPRWRRK
jgi:DNA invertase Pin-like site-specific DNA recombinase